MVFSLEDSFAEGKGSEAWQAPPPGTFFSSTHSRGANKITAEGTKFWETVSWGTLAGSWDWSFTLDYDYMAPLLLAFESHDVTDNGDGTYTHTFSKINNGRVPSFTVRRKVLNRMAGGPDGADEIVELRGCVCKSISFSMSAGNSAMQVSMTGFYVEEKMYKGDLTSTDYQEYSGDLVEFACLFVGDPSDENYVANTDSLSIGMDNSSAVVYSTCTPFGVEYYEGVTQCTFGTSCYSNDPSRYKQRVYSGGYNNSYLFPQSKNLAPISKLSVAAYSLAVKDGHGENITECMAQSPKTAVFTLEKVVIKSLTWQKGDGSKLQDQISSTDCRKISFRLKNDQEDLLCHDVISNPSSI